MNATFPVFLREQLLKHEGGYVDHPRDPGGATNMGITHQTLGRWRGKPVTKADVRALRVDEVEQIYREFYWKKCGADLLPAGPDAALFDVAVNSGVGRAQQWKPLTYGKAPVEAVKAVCARRRSFFRALSTFDVFGKGWMRRVNEVEAWCIRWAMKTAHQPAVPVIETERKASEAAAKKSSGAAAGGTVAGGTVTTQVDWVTVAVIAVPIVLAIMYLIYNAVAHANRAQVLKEIENV